MSELKGTLAMVGPVEAIPLRNGGELKKRTIVIDFYAGTRTVKAAFVVQVDSVNAEINHIMLGSEVTVYYNIESREWNSKWFTDLKVWRITNHSCGAQPVSRNGEIPYAEPTKLPTTPAEARKYSSDNHPANQPGFEDDLPF